MAKVAEGTARVAAEISTARRQRSELAAEIKGETRRRYNDVRSLLDSLRAARVRATREHALEAKKITKARHEEVHSLVKGLKAARGRAGHEYQRDAVATIGKRRGEVRVLLTRFRRELVVFRQHRRELSVAQRERAAAFMRGLTSGVASLCDGFAKEGRDRAAAVRGRLAAYALDRRNAVAIWRGSDRAARSDRLAARSPVSQTEPPASTGTSAETDTAAAHSPDSSAKPGRRHFGSLGLRSSTDPRGGDSK